MKNIYTIIAHLLKIGLISFTLVALAYVVMVMAYFAMLAYFAYKDDTIYEYQEFKCKNHTFVNGIPISLRKVPHSNIVDLSLRNDEDAEKVYPPGEQFKIKALYSLYDFEGGTFYDYLIETPDKKKAFLDFNDIDPINCTLDEPDKYWFRNIKQYYPNGDKKKISKEERDRVFHE